VRLLVAGGAGFIGSKFAISALRRWPECELLVYDALTYAGNLANLREVLDDERVTFTMGDICSPRDVHEAMAGCTHVVNFAAETHVDRSLLDPGAFVRTDVEGTRVLLEAVRDLGIQRFVQVSTDEVYGHIEFPRRASEGDALAPRSPYAASKASGDLMVMAYHASYDIRAVITRGSNTYGPNQYPEKLIPLFVTNALDGLPLPVYGDGLQMRDWLHVDDHCSGIATALECGLSGEIYNIGTESELPNMAIIEKIVALTGCESELVRHVPDRPGHDRRYALNNAKIRSLGWKPSRRLEEALTQTVEWYRSNRAWWEPIKSGEFRTYYQLQYAERLEGRLA
jgi:dTDP-glucose 4,6-dehydratase